MLLLSEAAATLVPFTDTLAHVWNVCHCQNWPPQDGATSHMHVNMIRLLFNFVLQSLLLFCAVTCYIHKQHLCCDSQSFYYLH